MTKKDWLRNGVSACLCLLHPSSLTGWSTNFKHTIQVGSHTGLGMLWVMKMHWSCGNIVSYCEIRHGDIHRLYSRWDPGPSTDAGGLRHHLKQPVDQRKSSRVWHIKRAMTYGWDDWWRNSASGSATNKPGDLRKWPFDLPCLIPPL